jgi:hypothetical protein
LEKRWNSTGLRRIAEVLAASRLDAGLFIGA